MATSDQTTPPPGLAPPVAALPLRFPVALPRFGRVGPEAVPAHRLVMRQPFARFRAHTHTRPLFLCRECGAPWPCRPARLALLVCYRGDPHGLRDFLSGRLLVAMVDQPRIDPTELTARFLGWIPPDP